MDLVHVSVVHDSAVSARIIYRIVHLSFAYACALFLPRHVAPCGCAPYFGLILHFLDTLCDDSINSVTVLHIRRFGLQRKSRQCMENAYKHKLNRECLYASEANEHL